MRRQIVERGLIELTDGTVLDFGEAGLGPDGRVFFAAVPTLRSLQQEIELLRQEVRLIRESLDEFRLIQRQQWAYLRDVVRTPNPPTGPWEPPDEYGTED